MCCETVFIIKVPTITRHQSTCAISGIFPLFLSFEYIFFNFGFHSRVCLEGLELWFECDAWIEAQTLSISCFLLHYISILNLNTNNDDHVQTVTVPRGIFIFQLRSKCKCKYKYFFCGFFVFFSSNLCFPNDWRDRTSYGFHKRFKRNILRELFSVVVHRIIINQILSVRMWKEFKHWEIYRN